MKLVALSDLHINQRGIPYNTIENIIRAKPDVLLIGGDVASSKKYIGGLLELFHDENFVKLAYLGNHDLRCLEGSYLGEHYSEMRDLFSDYGFHLLDDKPFIHNKVGFIGNCGWFDFSLHYTGEGSEKMSEYYFKTYRTKGKTPIEFTDECVERVRDHHKMIVDNCDKMVLGFHHIGFRDMLFYGHSELFDFKNLKMGSEKLKKLYKLPKVELGLCGHNHRPYFLEYYGCPVYNISSEQNKSFLELNI